MHKTRITGFLLVTTLVEIINRFSPFLLLIYAQRKLGIAAFGFAQVSLAMMEMGLLFVTCGYHLVTAQLHQERSTLDRPGQLGELAASLIALRLVQAILVTGTLLLICTAVPTYQPYRATVAGLSFILFLSATELTFVQLTVQRFIIVNLASGVSRVLALVAVYLLVTDPSDAFTYAFLLLFANGVVCLVSFSHATRYLRFQRPSLELIKLILGRGIGVALVFASFGIVERLDLLLAEHLLGGSAAGIYSGPFRLCASVAQLITALGMIFFSEILIVKDQAAHSKHVSLALWVACLVTLPLAAGVWFIDDFLLVFLFGPELAGHGRLLSVLMTHAFVYSLAIVFSYQVLLVKKQVKPLLFALIATAAVQLAVSHLMISVGDPLVGLAVAAVTAKGGFLLFCFGWSRGHMDPIDGHPFRKLLYSCLIMVAVLLFSAALHPLGRLAMGAVSYGAAVFLFNRTQLLPILASLRDRLRRTTT